MVTIVKILVLFTGVFIVMPVVFFLLVGFFGKLFSVRCSKSSVIARLRKD